MAITLYADVSATDTYWFVTDAGDDLDDLAFPSLCSIGSEQVEITGLNHNPVPREGVRAVFVSRRRNNTTPATHPAGATLAPVVGSGESGGAAVPDPSGAPDGQVVVTLNEELVLGSTLAAVDTVTGAIASVQAQASEDNGQASVTSIATDALDMGATVSSAATTDGGAALVQHTATAAEGTATARLDAATGTGVAEARVAVTSPDGLTVLSGITATHEAGGDDSLVITDGFGLTGEPDEVLTADATVGSKWAPPVDPLTSAGAIVISAAAATNILTLAADGSWEINGAQWIEGRADGLIVHIPTSDPTVAGALWNNNGVVMVSAG